MLDGGRCLDRRYDVCWCLHCRGAGAEACCVCRGRCGGALGLVGVVRARLGRSEDRNLATAVGGRYIETTTILRGAHRLRRTARSISERFCWFVGCVGVVVVPRVRGQERGGAVSVSALVVTSRDYPAVRSFDSQITSAPLKTATSTMEKYRYVQVRV